ncbi:transposase [Vibrio mediterranei]|uniref:transposase n=1 Tax=Vibrio mediterranei TaxID=689 RepID=UPI001EFDE949|nr:transposase [Vibrio mediterranei]MCG9659967.1 transposase [Vibrio mediterranei]
MEIEYISETTAAMLYTTLSNGKQFLNERQASAPVGLTPKQHNFGDKVFMVEINSYLRREILIPRGKES